MEECGDIGVRLIGCRQSRKKAFILCISYYILDNWLTSVSAMVVIVEYFFMRKMERIQERGFFLLLKTFLLLMVDFVLVCLIQNDERAPIFIGFQILF